MSVLDGGFVNWEALGYATESGPAPNPQVGYLIQKVNNDLTFQAFVNIILTERKCIRTLLICYSDY